MTSYKTIVKVFVYGEEVFSGTLDSAIKFAQKRNRKYNSNVSSLEIWHKTENYFLVSVPEFWNY